MKTYLSQPRDHKQAAAPAAGDRVSVGWLAPHSTGAKPWRALALGWLLLAANLAANLGGCYRQHEEARDLSAAAPSFSSSSRQKHPLPALPPIPGDVDSGDRQNPRSPERPDEGAGPIDRTPTTPKLKVALLGDQGMGDHARAVLQLIAQEGADMVIHLGDLSYELATPADWEAQVDAVLGHDFPYFAVIGNHDVPSWFSEGGFAQLLAARLSRIEGAHCEGEYAINASCTYRGLHFVMSGIGTFGEDHEAFLRDALETSHAQHSLCLWHKNQHDMQVGGKADEVGWAAYQICAEHGAPIITGHEHSYSRTYALTAVGDRSQGHGAVGLADELRLGPGRTFVAVSGLGGQSARRWTSDHSEDTWWASIYAGDRQVMNGKARGTDPVIGFGALFVTFGVTGNPARAHAYFKTTTGVVADEFSWLTSH